MATKKPDLSEALRQASGRTAAASPTPTAAPRTKHFRPSRQGTKTIAGHYSIEARKQFRQLAFDQDTTVQELLGEAINDLFTKYGLSPLA